MIFKDFKRVFSVTVSAFLIICFMVFKKSDAEMLILETKQFVKKSILDVEFSDTKIVDLLVYIVDNDHLKDALKSPYGKMLQTEIDFNSFEPVTGKVADIGFINGQKVVFVGFGKSQKKNERLSEKKDDNLVLQIQKLGAKIADLVPADRKTVIGISNKFSGINDEMLVEAYFGFNQKNYRFSKYLTNEEALKKNPNVNKVILSGKTSDVKVQHKGDKLSKDHKDDSIEKLIKKRQNQLEGIFYARSLGNEPANVIFPESFASEINKIFSDVKNVKVKVLTKKDLEKLNMNMLLGVAQGSVKEPKVVVVEYRGNPKKKDFDLALVGKGVTFDSGGLSLKPSPHMEGMKCDMLGAATVMSGLLAMAKNCVKINAVAVAGMVENMPSGNAQKVGDIVKSMSGKTVEIIDTDAEGRLVLGDVLYYAQSTYKPKYMIDMATLTGAIMVALGTERAGIFSNNEEMAEKIKASGEKTGDRCWVMPMGEEYAEAMKSQIADLRNLSSVRYAGSATAGEFLHNFIGDNKNWAHIDIAGVDVATKNNSFGVTDFASGFGVKLLNDFVESNIESN